MQRMQSYSCFACYQRQYKTLTLNLSSNKTVSFAARVRGKATKNSFVSCARASPFPSHNTLEAESECRSDVDIIFKQTQCREAIRIYIALLAV